MQTSEGSGEPPRTEFGELLRRYRTDMKLSQETLANMIGKRTATIQELENKPRRPQKHTLDAICSALKLSPERRSELTAAAGRVRPAAATDEPPKRSFRINNPLVIGAVVLLAVIVGIAIIRLVRPTPASKVVISSPGEGTSVASALTARGTATLRPGTSLWLLLKPISDKTYYLTDTQSVEITEDGQWASRLTVGTEPDDEGAEFYLIALVAPNGGMVDKALSSRPEGQFSARFSRLPTDSVVGDRVRFKLGRFVGG